MKVSVKEIILFGVLAGFITISQMALSFLPSIEIVSLLIIIFSLIYRKKALYIVYTYVTIIGIVYGFGVWWFAYLILWPMLSIFTCIIKQFIEGKYFILAIYSGIFGLMFGFFYAIPYVAFSGFKVGIAYWIRGIGFDIIHAIANYFTMRILGERVFNLLNKLNTYYYVL